MLHAIKDELTVKSQEVNNFFKILELVKNKEHLTLEGIEKIKLIIGFSSPETEANTR